jgi:antitoxin (DNA-binding transcriptional repressor) of toxin-antitoxin stability system
MFKKPRHTFLNYWSRLAGQEIILAKAGKPYARLMLLATEPARRQPGRLQGKVDEAFFDSLPEEELNVWDGR